MKVAVGRLAEKVTVGIRASKVTEMNSGTTEPEGEADDEGLTDALIEALGEMLGLIDADGD